MQRVRLFGIASLICLFSAAAGPASAQTATDERPAIGIGYQFMHLSAGGDGLGYPLGFNLDGGWPLPMNRLVSVIGEFGWSRHSEDAFSENLLNFDGGIRGNFLTEAARLYGQVTFGLEHTSVEGFGSNDALLGLDGGVNLPLEQLGEGNLFAQAGYRRVFYEGSGANGFRFLLGVRFPLGATP
jgi:hypothetical protein